MRRGSGSDHLAHSFTDLMTSLMVIFILLLLVFVNNQGSANSAAAQTLLNELRRKLEPAGFKNEDIRIDPKDPSTILLTMLDAQLNFQPNSYQLQPAGERFLETRMPQLAAVLCADKYRNEVEAVVFEGHSDNVPYRGATPEESQARNLRLSQERSMEVVEKTLTSLPADTGLRTCLLDKVSASGRGEQDLEETADKSRRAVIKIRVNATHAADLARLIPGTGPAVRAIPAPTANTLQILDLFVRLRAVPHQPVHFHLSDDEINQYLVYALLKTPRPGLDSITVKFFPHNYVSTVTVIDFDEIDSWSPGLVAGLLNLKGKRALLIDMRFTVRDGQVTFKVEKGFYQDKKLSLYVAEKIVQAVGAQSPEGFTTGEEMPLPFGIRQASTGEGFVEGEN
jgi:outer membrane protein OmpA-like peptidoglycan-associated protein